MYLKSPSANGNSDKNICEISILSAEGLAPFGDKIVVGMKETKFLCISREASCEANHLYKLLSSVNLELWSGLKLKNMKPHI